MNLKEFYESEIEKAKSMIRAVENNKLDNYPELKQMAEEDQEAVIRYYSEDLSFFEEKLKNLSI